MPVARPELSDSRVIAHVDMDCFYVQVEQRKQQSLRGQPTAVVQYNSWQGGGLIAVSYEARKFGVKRSMRGDEAKQVCPEIHLVQVPVARGKADLNTYRNAGSEVVSILSRRGRCERASIDEVYLDLTIAAEAMLADNPPECLETISEEVVQSHVLGLEEVGSDARENVRHWFTRSDASRRDKLLACGAFIVAELRLQVLEETEFTCSAGIAHNKMLAKLASGMNKPAQQTVVPFSSISKLLRTLPIKKMKQLGGKLGTSLQIDLGVNTVGDLLQFSEEKLQEYYGVNTGSWLWNTARGINGEEVKERLLPNSHGSGKTFPGPRALKTVASVEKWLNELCEELSERLQSDLEQNRRIAHTLTLHAHAYKVGFSCQSNDADSFRNFPSKSCPLRYGTSKIKEDALSLFQAGLREYLGQYNVKISGNQKSGWGITGLSVSASKIVAIPSGTRSIMNYFHNQEETFPQVKLSSEQHIQDAPLLSPSEDSLESGGHLTLQSIEPWIACREENEETKYSMPLDRQEEDKDTCKEKLPDKETSICSSPDAEVYRGWEKDQTESSGDYLTVKIRDSLESEEGKRKSNKEKGMSTISRYFQSQLSGSLLKAEHAGTSKLSESSSLSACQSELPQENSPARGESSVDAHLCSQIKLKRPSWSYDIDEIDQDILNELPKQIQEEVQAWLRPQKRPNTVKRDLGITRYFLPAKDK
ncbi:DNA polymerase eta isoform X2 [Solanum stenotomum]|uniref:DNA polymerase eta isoform X2 n=1 Tax=Solanum stenotomum TaxID=172797 RepID=UPI0020D05B6B|nr:DNA polymerase eta isoform X2 [Solanum stenotomum]